MNENSISFEKTSIGDVSIITDQLVFKSGMIKPLKVDDQLISFRSKKENQITNVEIQHKDNYILDKDLIAIDICSKLNTRKNPEKENYYDENKDIRKIFSNIKEESFEKELLNTPDMVEDNQSCDSSAECDENIFWNLRRKIDQESCDSERRARSVNNKSIKTSKIGSMIATLSKIETGKAIFVTEDDFIFIIPILSLPKNIIVGNTYNFNISEHCKYQNRLSNIHENIQKNYIKKK
jgi:hypothetical protein